MSLTKAKMPSVVDFCNSRAKHSARARRNGGERVSFLEQSTAVAPYISVVWCVRGWVGGKKKGMVIIGAYTSDIHTHTHTHDVHTCASLFFYRTHPPNKQHTHTCTNGPSNGRSASLLTLPNSRPFSLHRA